MASERTRSCLLLESANARHESSDTGAVCADVENGATAIAASSISGSALRRLIIVENKTVRNVASSRWQAVVHDRKSANITRLGLKKLGYK